MALQAALKGSLTRLNLNNDTAVNELISFYGLSVLELVFS
jgi:hypothetical protein